MFSDTDTDDDYDDEICPKSKTFAIEIDPTHIMNCIMEYYVRHKSKWSEIEHILHLINKIAKRKIVPVSKYSFMKYFDKSIEYNFHVSCSNIECKAVYMLKPGSSVNSIICQKENCKTVSAIEDLNVEFVTFEIESQIRELLEKYKYDLIFPDKPLSEFPIEDVWNGKIHRKILENTKKPFVSLTLNTDGVAIFKSNSKSLWPIIISVNNLSLQQRFKQDNLIIAGFHLSTELNMATFLEPLAMEIQKLNSQQGIKVGLGRHKVFCTLSSLDAPAKAKLQNMMQFNGHFGCPYCTDEGQYLEGCVRFSCRLVGYYS